MSTWRATSIGVVATLVTIFATPAQAAKTKPAALPQFLGVDSVARTPVEVTDEHLQVQCDGEVPTLHCTCSSVLTVHNPTDKSVVVELEVDVLATGWSVDGQPGGLTPGKPTTGDDVVPLPGPVSFSPGQTREITVLYGNPIVFDGSPEAANLEIPGLSLAPPITYRHPVVARPRQRPVGLELWLAGARNDRWSRVSKHSATVRVPARWLVHSTTGMIDSEAGGVRVITLSSTLEPSSEEMRFRMKAELAAPQTPSPIGPLFGVGYGWEPSCSTCSDSLRVRTGFDVALSYWWSLGVVGEFSWSKREVAAVTIDGALPLSLFRGFPMITGGLGAAVRVARVPELGVRGQVALGWKLGPIYLGGALVADWFPRSTDARWSLAPMVQLGL